MMNLQMPPCVPCIFRNILSKQDNIPHILHTGAGPRLHEIYVVNAKKYKERTSIAIYPGLPTFSAARSTHFKQEGPGSSQYEKDCPQRLQGTSLVGMMEKL